MAGRSTAEDTDLTIMNVMPADWSKGRKWQQWAGTLYWSTLLPWQSLFGEL